MPTEDLSTLVHLVGFITGAALYAVLGVIALQGSSGERSRSASRVRRFHVADRMAAATGALGVTWNLGGLFVYGMRDLGAAAAPQWALAIAFAALGFLPAVAVHATSRNLPKQGGSRGLVAISYGLSALAAGAQFEAALVTGAVPSRFGLRLLAGGYVAVTVGLAALTRRRPGWRKSLSSAALAAFALMALHLSLHGGPGAPWWVELIGHQASIPLAVAILYQDYRFALADIFLKRLLAVGALLVITLAVNLGLVAPFLVPRLAANPFDPQAVAALTTLWLAVAVSYPALRLAAGRLVDKVLLRRADYGRVREDIVVAVGGSDREADVLDAVCRLIAPALRTQHVSWLEGHGGDPDRPAVSIASWEGRQEATVTVATADPPTYILDIAGLEAGRVLLSDDLHMLEAAASIAAHRINAIRLSRERMEATVRENEILQLATEAELRAIRAQLNPHFLFNALTTIGYLMRAAPDRALDTLYRLTDLLRAVLRRSEGAFITLAQEVETVASYLAIESARFEERLHVTLDIPTELRELPVPPLILQPIVENAVKHGITPRAEGGSVVVSARLDASRAPDVQETLRLSVVDTGVGASPSVLARRRVSGIGLSSVERRLERLFGEAASIEVRSAPGVGTTVELCLPTRAFRQPGHRPGAEVAS